MATGNLNVVEATSKRRALEEARRERLYRRMCDDPRFCHLTLEKWSRDTVAFLSDAAWAPDEHGDFGGGTCPYIPYPKQVELVRLLDWMAEPQKGVVRRRDGMAKKSRQVGLTQTVIGVAWKLWLFRDMCSIIITSYEEDAVDKGGKGARIPEHLFGKLRWMMDRLVEKCPCLRFNQGCLTRGDHYDVTPCGAKKSEDVKFQMVRPRLVVHGVEVFAGAAGNVLKGDLPDDTTGKSRTYFMALFDEIGEGRPGVDQAMWDSCAPCCRRIFGFGTIPKDAREDSRLYIGTENPGPSMTPFWFHWTQISVYMQGAYFVCRNDTCEAELEWPYRSPAAYVDVTCPECSTRQSINERSLRSPWFDDMCATFNHDAVAIARYLQGDWDASIGDNVFYTMRANRVVTARDAADLFGWDFMHGYDPGKNRRNPACWTQWAFDPIGHVLRAVGYWMKHGVPIEWWLPFVKQVPYRDLHSLRIMSGANVGRNWLECYRYTAAERKAIDRAAEFPRGPVYGDRYGDVDHGGAGAAYNVWRRYGVTVRCKSFRKSRGGKWGAVEKARDLYVPNLEIDPAIADLHPVDGTETYLTLKSALAKVRQADSETGKGEPSPEFDKRVPRHASHPADCLIAVTMHLPDRIEGKVTPSGHVVHVSSRVDLDGPGSTYGESLGSIGYRR